MKNKVSILSTRILNAELIKQTEAKGITIDAISFIETQPIRSIEVQQEIEQAFILSATVVFTSVNAVEAVAAELDEQRPGWQIFCIGHATRQCCEKYFGEGLIAGIADNAGDLANVIIDAQIENVIFFCGDQRRDELPDLLRNNNIDVNEIVVYETIAISQKIEKKYDGILFFSPSAVQSFFGSNQSDDQTVLFAIGNTTANEIKKYSRNKIIVSDEPEKSILLKKVADYFQANRIHN